MKKTFDDIHPLGSSLRRACDVWDARKVIIKDVTPEGYGPMENKPFKHAIQKLRYETLDEAIMRLVGYQIDNGLMVLTQDRDGWKGTIKTPTGLQVIRAYKKQDCINAMYSFWYDR